MPDYYICVACGEEHDATEFDNTYVTYVKKGGSFVVLCKERCLCTVNHHHWEAYWPAPRRYPCGEHCVEPYKDV